MSGPHIVLVLGLALNAIALPFAGKRVWFLFTLIKSGQPAPDRVENITQRVGTAVKTQIVEVFGQKKLLKWTIPGAAHFFVFWAFVILASVYLEAYGSLFHEGFHIPVIGHWAILGFAQDFIAMMCLISLVVFTIIRFKNSPARLGRNSRFKGSHLSGAWWTLIMIFFVIASMMLFRGASVNTDHLPYGNAAYMSHGASKLMSGLSFDTNLLIERVGLLLHIGVMLAFLILVLHSKHLHIFLAPINVLFGRRPVALGALKPLTSAGKPITLDDIDDLDEDTTLGIGKIEDFSWKGMLDFSTCTECGRCQSQCPAWNTEKPLSPKLLIMGLRDHAMAKAPYILADSDDARAELPADVLAEAARPLVGETEGDAWEPTGGAIIDNDVLWSCTNCGACVNQCPVDIEHVDHIVDMRRYQVLVESNFPTELNGLFKGLENKGNPWNMSPTARLEWTQGLDFEVKVLGGDGANDPKDMDEVDWLFWVGCAGAYEDRAKKTTRAVAELLNIAGVDFAILGNGETCTGDPARRAGNEFVFQGLAAQNIETFKEMKVKKVVSTCAHCFNTLKNEYRDFGIELEVVHHTQLLNRLVREKKLAPVAAPAGSGSRSITYHDPCFLGRHNQEYRAPRELLEIIPNAELTEMPRNSERSFCCGAGGARMWMEETIGERINLNRTKEAVATGADQIAVACPFCRTMLEDGLTEEQSEGNAREEVEVLDVAQLLLASVKGEVPTPKAKSAAPAVKAAVTVAPVETPAVTTEAATPAAPATGGSLFDTPAPAAPAADSKAAGGSLFDTPAPAATPAAKPKPSTDLGSGSLFDTPAPEQAKAVEAPAPAPAKPAADLGGSLFDIAVPEAPKAAEAARTEPAATAEPPSAEPEPTDQAPKKPKEPKKDIDNGSLFDL